VSIGRDGARQRRVEHTPDRDADDVAGLLLDGEFMVTASDSFS
jgi:hypothetical protein